jgi:hypothetical protein
MNGMNENILDKLIEFFTKLGEAKQEGEPLDKELADTGDTEGKDPKDGKLEMLSIEAKPKMDLDKLKGL